VPARASRRCCCSGYRNGHACHTCSMCCDSRNLCRSEWSLGSQRRAARSARFAWSPWYLHPARCRTARYTGVLHFHTRHAAGQRLTGWPPWCPQPAYAAGQHGAQVFVCPAQHTSGPHGARWSLWCPQQKHTAGQHHPGWCPWCLHLAHCRTTRHEVVIWTLYSVCNHKAEQARAKVAHRMRVHTPQWHTAHHRARTSARAARGRAAASTPVAMAREAQHQEGHLPQKAQGADGAKRALHSDGTRRRWCRGTKEGTHLKEGIKIRWCSTKRRALTSKRAQKSDGAAPRGGHLRGYTFRKQGAARSMPWQVRASAGYNPGGAPSEACAPQGACRDRGIARKLALNNSAGAHWTAHSTTSRTGALRRGEEGVHASASAPHGGCAPQQVRRREIAHEGVCASHQIARAKGSAERAGDR